MQDKERLETFKQAIGRAFKKLVKGTSPSTVFYAYDITTSLLTPLNKGIKDPQLSTVFRISQAYQIDPRIFLGMVIDELPPGFVFADE